MLLWFAPAMRLLILQGGGSVVERAFTNTDPFHSQYFISVHLLRCPEIPQHWRLYFEASPQPASTAKESYTVGVNSTMIKRQGIDYATAQAQWKPQQGESSHFSSATGPHTAVSRPNGRAPSVRDVRRKTVRLPEMWQHNQPAAEARRSRSH